MNVIKISVNFKTGQVIQNGIDIVTGDYNSTKLLFDFDDDYSDDRLVFEMCNPKGKTCFVKDIVNNEVVLVGDDNGEQYPIFDMPGKWEYEVSLYRGNSKLTSGCMSISVRQEQVKVGNNIVHTYMPIFDELIKEVSNLDIDATQSGNTTTVTITKKNGETKTVEIGGGSNSYTQINKIKDYLYDTVYLGIDYDYAMKSFKDDYPLDNSIGGCSSFVKNGLLCRNFDWTYDNNAEFIVRTPNIGNRYASIGVASAITGLTNDFVESGEYSDLYKILPFRLVDGVNEKGLSMEVNVVPSGDKGINKKTVPLVSEDEEICATMLIRYVLDNFDNATDAVEHIRDHVSIYYPSKLIEMGYESHWIITDGDNSYILETVTVDGTSRNVIIQTDKTIITNFHISGVTFNADGSVYTPSTKTATESAMVTNHITENGAGLERFNIINDNYGTIETAEDIFGLLNSLLYTKSYTLTDDVWYTEFVGNGLTPDSDVDEFEDILQTAREYYEERDRGLPKTWQTTHSSVYDIKNKTLSLSTQEESVYAVYTYDGLKEFELVSNRANEIGTNTDNNHYPTTKAVKDYVDSKPGVKEADGGEVFNDYELSEAPGNYSHAEGYRTHARGDYSHTEGFVTYVIDPDDSGAVEGWRQGIASHAEGNNTEAAGDYSHAEGANTVTNNPTEHAEGRWNYSNSTSREANSGGNTQHSVGIGTTLETRRNAFEIMQNGDAYFYGIGGYDGTNAVDGSDSTTLKEVIESRENITNKTTEISSASTNSQYPSAKAVYDYIQSLNGNEVQY